MIAALFLALLQVRPPAPTVVPVDTGWQRATINRDPYNPPTFRYRHVPAPAGTTSVRVCLTMEMDAWIEVENRDKAPHSLIGSLSLRNYQAYDRHGWSQFWFRETGGVFYVDDLQPDEERYVHVTYSLGPVCENEWFVAGWLDPIKWGQFDTYVPVIFDIDGHPVDPNDYDVPKQYGLSVYVDEEHWIPYGRLHGYAEFR